MADYLIKGSTLSQIADSLRSVGKFSSRISPASMPKYILGNLTSNGVVDGILDRTIESIDNYTCTALGPYAFAECSLLNKVYMDKCNTVGVQAFVNCIQLNEVDMNLCHNISESAFLNCSNLEIINMPNCGNISGSSTFHNCKPKKVTMGVQDLTSDSAFGKMLYKNTNLEELYLPQCQLIYSSTLLECSNLTKIEAPNVTIVTQSAFYKCYALKEIDFPELGTPITERNWDIGAYAFASCSALEKVNIPIAKSINNYCFANCASLKEFYAPCVSNYGSSDPFLNVTTLESFTEARTTIKDWHTHWPNLKYYSNSVATSVAEKAFHGCSLLNEYGFYAPNLAVASPSAFQETGFIEVTPETFPALSGTLGNYAFYTCPNLKSVHLSLITSTGNRTFASCPNLEYVKLDNVTSMYTHASYPAFINCTSLKEVHLPAYSSSIVANWFNNLTTLKNVDIPLATAINTNAFKGCVALSKVSFPNVTTIQASAFDGCTSLEEIEIGTKEVAKTLTLQTKAFSNCTSLRELTIYYSSVATLANATTVFDGTGITATTGSIYVPGDLLDSYKTATNWSNYQNRIFPYDATVFSIRGAQQKVMGTGNKTWTDWQNTSNYNNNATYYFKASSYSQSWPNYVKSYYSNPNHTGVYMPYHTSIFKYPLTTMQGYRAGYSDVNIQTTLYQTSIPGTFSFVGYSGRIYSYGMISRPAANGSYITYYSVSTINTGTSYISYFKFADSTATITPDHDYQTGTITSSLT